MTITHDLPTAPQLGAPNPAMIRRTLEHRSIATLATVSAAGRPHAATVLYQCAGDALFVSTSLESRKARNVAGSGNAAITVFVRRLPFGPPSSIQFQTTATVLANDDPEVAQLASAGRLRNVTSHGELDLPGGCFLRLAFPARAATYGLGMSLWRLMRDPLNAAGQVSW